MADTPAPPKPPGVPSSRLPGFYKQSVAERRAHVAEAAQLAEADVAALAATAELSEDVADRMIENVVGTYSLPVGVATNFRIDGADYLVPFVVEEASVVAAASNAAKRCHRRGGFSCEVDAPVMTAQVELRGFSSERSASAAASAIRDAAARIGAACDAVVPSMVKRGGGFRGIDARVLPIIDDDDSSHIVVAHVEVDCRDAMGANLVNTVAEAVAPTIADVVGSAVREDAPTVGLRILTNLATKRLARATARFTPGELATSATADDGEAVARGILAAYRFARADPYRACTNNKGVMNAISSVALATGQDWRAVEAAAHAYCALKAAGGSSFYAPMADWAIDADTGDLVGTLELPIAVGLVGGAVKVHPAARANVNILGVTTAADLAKVLVAAGLAQNFAALRALATDGIQRGHMRLHERSRGDQASQKASS